MWRWSGQISAGVGCTDLGLSVVAAPAPVRMFVSLHFNGAQHRARSNTHSSKQLRTRREKHTWSAPVLLWRQVPAAGSWLLRPGTDSHLSGGCDRVTGTDSAHWAAGTCARAAAGASVQSDGSLGPPRARDLNIQSTPRHEQEEVSVTLITLKILCYKLGMIWKM